MLKHSRKGKKHQVGTGIGRNPVSEASWEDDKARHNGNQGIHACNAYGLTRELVVTSNVAAENGHTANANGKHEERLAHCGIQDFSETGAGIVEEVIEVRQQVECQTFLTTFKKA